MEFEALFRNCGVIDDTIALALRKCHSDTGLPTFVVGGEDRNIYESPVVIYKIDLVVVLEIILTKYEMLRRLIYPTLQGTD